MAQRKWIGRLAWLALLAFSGSAAAGDKPPTKDDAAKEVPKKSPAKKDAKQQSAPKKDAKAAKKDHEHEDGEE